MFNYGPKIPGQGRINRLIHQRAIKVLWIKTPGTIKNSGSK